MKSLNEATNENLQFDGQRSDENVLLFFRRSIFSIIKYILLSLFVIFLAVFPMAIFGYNQTLLIVGFIGIVVGVIIFIHYFCAWYYTLYIFSDQRIRQIRQEGIFKKNIIDLDISTVQNIRYKSAGILGEILHFGTIIIQTTAGDLVINKVSKALNVYNDIQNIIRQYN